MKKRRTQSEDLSDSAVVTEVISCACVGYFPLMLPSPFGGRKLTGITNGARITSTVVRLRNAAKKYML